MLRHLGIYIHFPLETLSMIKIWCQGRTAEPLRLMLVMCIWSVEMEKNNHAYESTGEPIVKAMTIQPGLRNINTSLGQLT